MRIDLLRELAKLRDMYLLSARREDGRFDLHNASNNPETKAFREAFDAAALGDRELRVWRRVCQTPPDHSLVATKSGRWSGSGKSFDLEPHRGP